MVINIITWVIILQVNFMTHQIYIIHQMLGNSFIKLDDWLSMREKSKILRLIWVIYMIVNEIR
jgi:hypothetical protein